MYDRTYRTRSTLPRLHGSRPGAVALSSVALSSSRAGSKKTSAESRCTSTSGADWRPKSTWTRCPLTSGVREHIRGWPLSQCVRRYLQHVSCPSAKNAGAPADDVTKKLKDALAFDQMDTRLATICTAHAETCQWLFARKEYTSWRDPEALRKHHGFFWIKGKPGLASRRS